MYNTFMIVSRRRAPGSDREAPSALPSWVFERLSRRSEIRFERSVGAKAADLLKGPSPSTSQPVPKHGCSKIRGRRGASRLGPRPARLPRAGQPRLRAAGRAPRSVLVGSVRENSIRSLVHVGATVVMVKPWHVALVTH